MLRLLQIIIFYGILLYFCYHLCKYTLSALSTFFRHNTTNKINENFIDDQKKREIRENLAKKQESLRIILEENKRKILLKFENAKNFGQVCGGELDIKCERHDTFCNKATPVLPRGDDSFGNFLAGKGLCILKPICRDRSKKGTAEYQRECVNDLLK